MELVIITHYLFGIVELVTSAAACTHDSTGPAQQEGGEKKGTHRLFEVI